MPRPLQLVFVFFGHVVCLVLNGMALFWFFSIVAYYLQWSNRMPNSPWVHNHQWIRPTILNTVFIFIILGLVKMIHEINQGRLSRQHESWKGYRPGIRSSRPSEIENEKARHARHLREYNRYHFWGVVPTFTAAIYLYYWVAKLVIFLWHYVTDYFSS